MKTTIMLSTLLSFTITSFTLNQYADRKSADVLTSEQMAIEVIAAFRHMSAKTYTTLFPTLAEFQTLMDENAFVYGDFLREAKEEFAMQYHQQLVPSVVSAFEEIIKQGKEKGLDWSTIRYQGIELDKNAEKHPVLTIVFTANGTEHHLIIEKTLVFHDQWKVSQFIRLV